MAHRLVYISGGDIEFNNQFGTVRRMLNDAKEGRKKAGKDGEAEVTHFAELQTEHGRVLVNPLDVSHVVEVKDGATE